MSRGGGRWRDVSGRTEERVEQVNDRATEASRAVEGGLVNGDAGRSVVFDAAEQAGVPRPPAAGDAARPRRRQTHS